MQIAQQDFQLRQQQINNEKDKVALQSQQMVQDAIKDHADNVMEVHATNAKIQSDTIKAHAEIVKANAGHKVDLVKHFSGLAHQAHAAERQA